EHAANLLGDHFSPAVAIFAPVYWLAPSANVLLLGQALALALAGPPLYAFARDRLGPTGGAALIPVVYALYPPVHGVALFQFHELALIVAPLTLALLALERGRRGLFLAATVASLTVKEEAAIVVVAMAPLWWLRRRDARMAIATAALGL